MSYPVKALVDGLKKLVDMNVNFVIIGDTVVQLALKKQLLEGDVDLFILEPSIFENEEFYREIAEENGWDYGLTEIGTPRLIAHIHGYDIVYELYENFMDFEIPYEVLNKARSIELHGLTIKVLQPEQYFVLKARQGVDLDKIKHYISEYKSIDYRVLKETVNAYPREDQEVIIERLRMLNLRV